MGWIPEHKMNPCPNSECSHKAPPHVDWHKQGVAYLSGWCPYCGIRGPFTKRGEEGITFEVKEAEAVRLWNLSFPARTKSSTPYPCALCGGSPLRENFEDETLYTHTCLDGEKVNSLTPKEWDERNRQFWLQKRTTS